MDDDNLIKVEFRPATDEGPELKVEAVVETPVLKSEEIIQAFITVPFIIFATIMHTYAPEKVNDFPLIICWFSVGVTFELILRVYKNAFKRFKHIAMKKTGTIRGANE